MLSNDALRGYNDLMILAILKEGDSYGYQISKEIRQRTAENYLIKETTLYSAFNRLVKNHYLDAYPGNETHGKKRTYYQLTAAGLDYYEIKKKEWQLVKQVVDAFIKEKDK